MAKLTPYNRFVKAFAQTYRGRGNMMRAAGAKWRKMSAAQKAKYGAKRRSVSRKKKVSRRKTSRRKTSRRKTRRRTASRRKPARSRSRTRTIYRYYEEPATVFVYGKRSPARARRFQPVTPASRGWAAATRAPTAKRRGGMCGGKQKYSCEASPGCYWTGASCLER